MCLPVLYKFTQHSFILHGDCFDFFIMYFIQHCFICRPSDSSVSEDAGIEPIHCDESERAVPGPSLDVSDQTFPGPEHDLLQWAEKNPLPARSSPGILNTRLDTCSHAGIFLEILLPQPGIF
jgi:hypothetical protein